MKQVTEVITSRQNPLLTRVTSLSERKYRAREGLFRFDGKKLFSEALSADLPLTAVLFRESSMPELLAAAGERELPDSCRAVCLPDTLFDRISEEKSPEGVICVSKYLDKIHKIITIEKRGDFLPSLLPGHTLVLESVRDPGNLGTVIRSARAFGTANVVLSADCADLYHPRTIRAAMGTLFHQHVIVTADVAGAIAALRSRGRVYATALDERAAALSEVKFEANDTAVIGNEGHGLTPAVIAAADAKLYIPMVPGVESLNAGVAASVVLWEFFRGEKR